MPVTVRNNSSTHVVLSTAGQGAPPATTWAPHGDTDGEDVQQIPDELAQGTRFLRACGMGILEVMDGDAAFVDSLRRQAAAYRTAQGVEEEQVASVLGSASSGDVLRIDEATLEAHIDRLSKSQPTDLS